MSEGLIELDRIDKLREIECPSRGNINFPCAVCQECEIGVVDVQMGDGVLIENTVNSILIHLELPIRDDAVEKAILLSLKSALSEKVPSVQKGTWDGGELSILITTDMINDKALISNIKSFLKGFPLEGRHLAIQARRALTDWAQKNSAQLAHKYFREL